MACLANPTHASLPILKFLRNTVTTLRHDRTVAYRSTRLKRKRRKRRAGVAFIIESPRRLKAKINSRKFKGNIALAASCSFRKRVVKKWKNKESVRWNLQKTRTFEFVTDYVFSHLRRSINVTLVKIHLYTYISYIFEQIDHRRHRDKCHGNFQGIPTFPELIDRNI